jgi:H+-transporting ATPase
MDVLCVDKTGTITMNKLTVTGVIPLEKATEADVLFAGALKRIPVILKHSLHA